MALVEDFINQGCSITKLYAVLLHTCFPLRDWQAAGGLRLRRPLRDPGLTSAVRGPLSGPLHFSSLLL